MRILAFAFAAAVAATPAWSADPEAAAPESGSAISGHGEIYLGGLFTPTSSVWAVGGAARVNALFANAWNLQGDVTVDSLFNGGTSFIMYDGVVHAYKRDPASHALGAFAQIGAISPVSAYHFRVGAEGQAYFADWTLYSQGWYGQHRQTSSPSYAHEIGARVVGRYFANDNLRFDGELAVIRLLQGGGPGTATVFSAAAQANYRFTDTPVTLFARYQGDFINSQAFHKATIGLRFTFGAATLREEDRNGATMDTYRMNIPFFGGT